MVDDLNDLPIKAVNGAVIYIRDVAHVRDGSPPQTNIVRVDGKRAILMTILKTGSASTLDIIAGIRAKLASITGQLPPQLKISAPRRPVASSSAAPSAAWCAKPSSPPASPAS